MPSPHVIVEAYQSREEGGFTDRLHSSLHLVEMERASNTLCGREAAHRTMIPLPSWGADDCEWCPRCERLGAARIQAARAEQLQREFVEQV